jgi:hypothetical protein
MLVTRATLTRPIRGTTVGTAILATGMAVRTTALIGAKGDGLLGEFIGDTIAGISCLSNPNGEAWPDLLLLPGSPRCTPCIAPRRLPDGDTFRAYGRALLIDTDIGLALPFHSPG